jgi:hypothetical protein
MTGILLRRALLTLKDSDNKYLFLFYLINQVISKSSNSLFYVGHWNAQTTWEWPPVTGCLAIYMPSRTHLLYKLTSCLPNQFIAFRAFCALTLKRSSYNRQRVHTSLFHVQQYNAGRIKIFVHSQSNMCSGLHGDGEQAITAVGQHQSLQYDKFTARPVHGWTATGWLAPRWVYRSITLGNWVAKPSQTWRPFVR